jgi:hypothetical protein
MGIVPKSIAWDTAETNGGYALPDESRAVTTTAEGEEITPEQNANFPLTSATVC